MAGKVLMKSLCNHLPKKRKKEEKWFEKQITKEQFETKVSKSGKYYGHHVEWKKTIWIGPYNTEDELMKVIASYVSITKKPFGQRKSLKNVHSIIMTEKDW